MPLQICFARKVMKFFCLYGKCAVNGLIAFAFKSFHYLLAIYSVDSNRIRHRLC